MQVFSNEDERIRLLDGIDAETNPLELRNLKEQYNQLVDRDFEQHRGSFSDPMDYFPPEIWIQIFRDVGSGDMDDDKYNPIDSLLLASLVSARWSDAILDTPLFWTEITVDLAASSWEDELFKLHTSMHLSGERLLALIFRPPTSSQWDGEQGIHRVIQNHRNRIQKIFFTGAWDANHAGTDMKKILSSLGHVPQLRVVHVVQGLIWGRPSWSELLANAPSLVSTNILLPLDILEREPIRSYRKIAIFVSRSLKEVPPSLFKLGPLESISLRGRPFERMPPDSSPPPVPLPPRGAANLGGVTELDCSLTGIQPVFQILQVALKLTTLSVDIYSWHKLQEFIETCHRLRLLDHLSIGLPSKPSAIDFSLSRPGGRLGVRSLIIKYTRDDKTRNQTNIALACPHLADLFDVLDFCTPAVRQFGFYAEVVEHIYIPFKYVSSRRHLLALTIHLPDFGSIPHDILIQSKTLGYLNLKINPKYLSKLFLRMDCPNLHRAIFLADKPYHRSGTTPLRPVVKFNPATLSQLTSIEWRTPDVFWRIKSFPALQKLILSGWSRETIPELCLDFIMWPRNCPSLEYIEFGVIPEWDLLFMMLERRNHSARYGVSRITTLVFPRAIPYSLITRITELLGGQFAIGLSYYDVSIASIAEFYFNSRITGCTLCLLSMHSCPKALARKRPAVAGYVCRWKRPKYPAPPAADPPLSDAMSSWLDGCEERARRWDLEAGKWHARRDSRETTCQDRLLEQRVVVTGLTLQGAHVDTSLADREN